MILQPSTRNLQPAPLLRAGVVSVLGAALLRLEAAELAREILSQGSTLARAAQASHWRGHLLDPVRVLRGEVVQSRCGRPPCRRAPTSRLCSATSFHLPCAHGAVALVLPEERVVRRLSGLPVEERREAHAFQRRDVLAARDLLRDTPRRRASRHVGMMSITWPASRTSPPVFAIAAGQCAISGVEMPPSWTQCL